MAQVQAERWVFSGTLRETLTDNLFFVAPDSPGESITGGTLSATYVHVHDQESLTAFGWANGQVYNRYGSYSGVMFGLGASGRHAFAPRARGWASVSYADGLNLEALYSGRVGLPQLDVKSGLAAAGLSYEFNPGTSVSTSFDATDIRYRTQTLLNTARLPADSLTPPDVRAPLNPGPAPDVPAAPDASLEALGILASQSLRVSRLDYWAWHAGVGLVHGISPKTRVTLDLGYRRTGQEPRTFAEGDQLEAQVGLRRALDAGANLSFNYTYQDNRFNPEVRTHSFGGQAEKELNSKVKGDVSLGASYLDSVDPLVSGWTFVGGAGVAGRLKRAFFAARYSRSRYQALVLGRNQVVDFVYASLGWTASRRVYLGVYGYYRNSRDPVDDLFSYDTGAVGVSLGARLGKRGSAGLSYDFRHFQTGSFPGADRSVLSFSLSYSRTVK